MDGVFPEPTPGNNRLTLWLRGKVVGGLQHWERISSIPGEAISVEQGLCATPATSLPAFQEVRGFVDKLLHRFQTARGERTWILPNGDTAEQSGERQTDLLLVWPGHDGILLDETLLKSRWPECQRCEKLSKNLYLLYGVPFQQLRTAPASTVPLLTPAEQAEQLLAAARTTGDRRQEALALTDLGLLNLDHCDAVRAVALLEEALTLTRQVADRSRESDVLAQMGMAFVAQRQHPRALEFLHQALALARDTGDRFAEKTALKHLGLAYASQRSHAQALAWYEQALALTRALGDPSTETDLLWYLAIEHANLGQRAVADAHAQAAIDLLEHQGKPQAACFAEHLRQYRQSALGVPLGGHTATTSPVSVASSLRGPGTDGASPSPAVASALSEPAASGPGLLRMALSAANALTELVVSGGDTVPAAVRQHRLQTCAGCEHHTGLRCRVCGCFTSVKAALPYEDCPRGKWPK
jgi:tetratricopeptide (TPR) repeat protein